MRRNFVAIATNPPVLAAHSLTLARGGRVLFGDLSFAAASGDFLDVRGPNGSGKTSLLRLIAGFLKPLAGAIEGADPGSLHYLGHRDGLKAGLDAGAHLRFWAGLLDGDAAEVTPALKRLGLAADWPARILSQGQGRRLALGRLLVAPRPIWLLDEPAAGLDAAGKTLLADLIAEHRARGGVVLAALHEPLAQTPSATIDLG